jgi:hypothetical protein
MKARLKKALKIAGIGVGGLFVVVTGVGLCLPRSIHVQRSIVVAGTTEDVFPLIASFKDGWTQWSPFEKEDPNMQSQFSGPDLGVGATHSWESEKMGEGHMEITKADPASGVVYDLNLMHDSYRLSGSLICEPAQGGTKVTWTDDIPYGANPYRRYLGLVVEKPLTTAFEQGLAALKTKVEARAMAKGR